MFKPSAAERLILSGLAAKYGVRYRLLSRAAYSTPLVRRGVINIATANCLSFDDLMNEFFHELGHIVTYRAGKYRAYHDQNPSTMVSRIPSRRLRAFLRTAWRAERHVDGIAHDLMAREIPWLTYRGRYHKKDAGQELLNAFSHVREELARRKRGRRLVPKTTAAAHAVIIALSQQ